MTTATIATNVVFSTDTPARDFTKQSKRRIGIMDLIATFSTALEATHRYETLVEKGAAPAEAARKALLG